METARLLDSPVRKSKTQGFVQVSGKHQQYSREDELGQTLFPEKTQGGAVSLGIF